MAKSKSLGPKDVKDGASAARREMKKKKGPKVEELSPKGVVREIKEDERRWKAESALRDFEQVAKHKQNPELMRDVENERKRRAACLENIKCETSMKTRR